LPKAYQMPNDKEKQPKNTRKNPFEGKKLGNNLALETSKQPSPEAKSEGWAKRRALIKSVTDWKNHAENNGTETVIMEDGTEQPMSDHIIPLFNLNKEAKKGNLQAIKIYYDITEAKKTENREVDESGKDKTANILVQMIKRGVKLT
jgi:hypothetical protein